MATLKTIRITASLCLSVSCYAQSTIKVTLDDTALCYPSRYSPNTSAIEKIIEPVKDQLDESVGEQLVYIPANEMVSLVKGYSPSHASEFNPAVPHDVSGIIYPISGFTDPDANAKEVWGIYQSLKEPIVIKDGSTGLYKVYGFEREIGPWSLVTSPPVKNPGTELPDNWYFGWCGELGNSYNCTIDLDYKSVRYQYRINEANMGLRVEIHDAVMQQVKQWEANCESR